MRLKKALYMLILSLSIISLAPGVTAGPYSNETYLMPVLFPQSSDSVTPLLATAWRFLVSAGNSICRQLSCCYSFLFVNRDQKCKYVPIASNDNAVHQIGVREPETPNSDSVSSHQELTIHNPDNYQQQLRLLLRSNNYSLGITAKDGSCFYHAVWSLTNIEMNILQKTMTSLLSTCEDSKQTEVQKIIQTQLGETIYGFVLSCILENRWGELSFIPVLAQALKIILGDKFEGIAVITPDNSSDSAPLITIYSPNGDVVTTTEFPASLPILVHETATHWTFAQPGQDSPLMDLEAPSTPVTETSPYKSKPSPDQCKGGYFHETEYRQRLRNKALRSSETFCFSISDRLLGNY